MDGDASSRLFDKQSGEAPLLQQKRGHVILWDDTFVRYHEPHIGIAAVKVLEAFGFEVVARKKPALLRTPCIQPGKPRCRGKTRQTQHSQLLVWRSLQYSLGRRSLGEGGSTPILFLEPSCWSMFVEDYRELKIENAENIAARCFLFEKFVADLLAQEPEALRFKHESRSRGILIHPHCHAKSILNPAFMATLAERLPGRKATVLDTACCGMAGAFGALAEKYDLSLQVAQRLLDQIDNQPQGTEVIASGTSCRHQITDLTNHPPKTHGGTARRSACVEYPPCGIELRSARKPANNCGLCPKKSVATSGSGWKQCVTIFVATCSNSETKAIAIGFASGRSVFSSSWPGDVIQVYAVKDRKKAYD